MTTSDVRSRPLLTVKQVIPPVRPGAVPRALLEQRLRAADTALTIVVAPAGWGKTSVLSAWAAAPGDQVRVGWVSLDESDDEPTRFWRYVLTALHNASDQISAAALDALGGSRVVEPVDLALPTLLNELAATTIRHVLVLDDFHVLTDPRIHESVEFLVGYLPPSLRLVIAGRADPPLPIARMRARGELTELRAADLRLSLDEATALVSTVAGADLDHTEAAAMWERTEGWAAGLQLAGLARRSNHGRTGTFRQRGDDRHLLDYFSAEVLPAITPEQRDLLVRAAPLERLSGSLCDAALQVSGSAEVLAALDRADLFVVALDAESQWYRCHHLFRDVLLREPGARSEADVRDVLRRAAAWFEAHDQVDEAIRHLLRAGDPAAAAELLRTSEWWFSERGAAATFLMLGDQLPNSAVVPQLALGLAYAAATNGRRNRVLHWLDVCEQAINADTVIPTWSNPFAAALMLRGLIGTSEANTGRAVELCRRAVELETDAGAGYRIALAALGGALALDGQFAQAVGILTDTWRRRDTIAWLLGVTLQVAGCLAWSLIELDRQEDVDAFLREAGPLADASEERWGAAAGSFVAMLRMAQGRHLYRRGDALAARDVLRHAVTVAELTTRFGTLVLSLVYLADAELGCGDRQAARAAMARAREIADDEPVSPFALRMLDEVETRIGRITVRSARRAGVLSEELTDRELSILRLLPGSASQREIGQALFLSVNTVKAYNKSLYRKLGVASREDAVVAARHLGLI